MLNRINKCPVFCKTATLPSQWLRFFHGFLSFLFLTFFTFSIQASAHPLKYPLQHWQTKAGTSVYFIHRPEIPMVDIAVAFHAGPERDSKTSGLAYLTANMLNQGTDTLSADQIAYRFDRAGAYYDVDVEPDKAIMHLRSLVTPHAFLPAIENFKQVLTHPTFPESALSRLKQQTIHLYQMTYQEGGGLIIPAAERIFQQMLYGPHPYGSATLGSPDSIKSISIQQIKDFYRHYYVARNGVIVIVGDLTYSQAMEAAEKLASCLPKGEFAPLLPSISVTSSDSTIRKVSYPSQQPSIIVGNLLKLSANDPVYLPLKIGNYIFGENFNSPLMKKIRIEQGLAYSPRSILNTHQVAGSFEIQLQTRYQEVNKALDIIQKTLTNFIKNGPTESQVTQAKQALVSRLPVMLSTNQSILSYVLSLVLRGFPIDYIDTFPEKIKKITRDQVHQALKTYIHPDQMQVLIFGEKLSESSKNINKHTSGSVHKA